MPAELGVTVSREYRPSKEYPNGQEVYALSFERDDSESPEASGDGAD